MVIKKIMNKLNKKDWKYHRRTIELSNHVSEFRREFKKNVATLFISALGLVGALFWQRAIDAYITASFPGDPNTWVWRFYAAVIMTFIAVIGIIFISKFSKD
jgi:ABC-type multidrug transport system fused ATPase/permease subunit